MVTNLSLGKECLLIIAFSITRLLLISGDLKFDGSPAIPNPTHNNDVYDFSLKVDEAASMEIFLGKIATEESVKPPVRSLATMISEDYGSMKEALLSAASKCNILLPEEMNENTQSQIDECFQEPCDSFDAKYIDIILNDHQNMLNEFRKASLRLSDPTIRNFARNFLPIIQKNLDSVAVTLAGLK